MPAADGALVGVVGHVHPLAAVFLRAADVEQLPAGLRVLEHLVAEGPDRSVLLLRGVVSAWGRDPLVRPRPAVELPPLSAAVHDPAVLVAIELEHPEGVAGPPVVLVAVEDDRRVVGDAPLGAEFLKGGPVDVVADDLALQVDRPVDFDGAGDVALRVEGPVLVRLDDPHLRVGEMLGHPLG